MWELVFSLLLVGTPYVVVVTAGLWISLRQGFHVHLAVTVLLLIVSGVSLYYVVKLFPHWMYPAGISEEIGRQIRLSWIGLGSGLALTFLASIVAVIRVRRHYRKGLEQLRGGNRG